MIIPLQVRQVRVRGPVVSPRSGDRVPALSRWWATRVNLSPPLPPASVQSRLVVEPDLVSPSWLVCVDADIVEFWQGDTDRMHTRVQYTRDGPGWTHHLLWPFRAVVECWMEFDFLCFDDEVDVLAGSKVEVGGGSGGDVGGQPRAAVGLVRPPNSDRGSVDAHFRDGDRDYVAGAGVWRIEVNSDGGRSEQRDCACAG